MVFVVEGMQRLATLQKRRNSKLIIQSVFSTRIIRLFASKFSHLLNKLRSFILYNYFFEIRINNKVTMKKVKLKKKVNDRILRF